MTLPLELQWLVLDQCVPEHPGYFPSERAELLGTLSLVNTAWHGRCLTHQFERVHLPTPSHAKLFLEQLKARPRLGAVVRSIRLGKLQSSEPLGLDHPTEVFDSGDASQFPLADIMSRCTAIKEVRISSLNNVEVTALSKAPSLEKLFVWASTLFMTVAEGEQDPVFPSLRHLYLTDVTHQGVDICSVLHARSRLPKLTALAEAFGSIIIASPLAINLPERYAQDRLEEGLTAISCAVPLASTRVSSSSIALLDCWTEELASPAAMHLLPPTLRIIRLNAHPEHGEQAHARSLNDFTAAFKHHFPRGGQRKLEEILVPAVPGRLYATAVEVLRLACHTRGVKLTVESRLETGEPSFFDDGFWAIVDRVDRSVL